MSYLYYVLYKFVLLTPSKEEQPEYIANILLTLVVSFNVFVLIDILQYYEVGFAEGFYRKKSNFVIMYAALFILGYVLFIRKKKYLEIVKNYDSEPKKRKWSKLLLSITYISTLVILIFVV